MKPELFWLVCTITMTGLFWAPYILNRMKELGILTAISNPNVDPTPTAQWAKRMMAAHRNAVENLIIFAPLVLLVDKFNIGTPLTAQVCMVYFYARLAHFIGYSAGIPFVRTVTFLIGFACQMALAVPLLSM